MSTTTPTAMSNMNMPGYVLAALSSLALVISALGPWATNRFPSASAAGTSTPDGKVVLGLGAAALLLVFVRAVFASRTVMVLAALCGVLGAVVGVVDIMDTSRRIAAGSGVMASTAEVGWGLWLTPIASAGVIVASIIVASTTHARSTAGTAGTAPTARTAPSVARAVTPRTSGVAASPTNKLYAATGIALLVAATALLVTTAIIGLT
ncbi:hypothetical protein HQ305_19785 [Rhodococcus sp. BP-149]|uniref:hypothetical protein n=1 Tax=unclassified Rhodococcus (in: high G+C Gram-positive bacteria) TaxID=192944 RepID=UPI001C9B2ED2|nr:MULTISPECIES: hypothetical protein [unclassified Rhodococcus (in: high G+C Gram-positive bacteria)]MBY6687478.1 hypothetical protein [Rhodococcus sp. BP-288]MBY6696427.1 hypothetical protein [Rhodococcus sp. BP-188]MBY6700559.1 hypothetical protein [Rhodococcus sp. BP-285]MBY6704418.1 hypothetical protein [Rhodococcus sp. BP-283]MBY6713684.1 hypothetical protein [Rhodococcus sp. BP-160]